MPLRTTSLYLHMVPKLFDARKGTGKKSFSPPPSPIEKKMHMSRSSWKAYNTFVEVDCSKFRWLLIIWVSKS